MRILFLCHRETDVKIGGLAEFLHFLPISLKKQNIESIIYTASDSEESHRLLENGVKWYSGPFAKPALFTSRKKLTPLFKLCEREKIDLIHAQGLYRSGYIALQIRKKLGIPYVITSHSDILTNNSDRMKRRTVQKRCLTILRHASLTTHLTPFMEDASHNILNTQEKSKIIGNGIDMASWKPFSESSEKNYLFAIGRLEKEKGFHILIEAYAELRKKGVKTSLMIAGTGSYESELQTFAKKLNLTVVTNCQDFAHIPEDSVIFTGYVRGESKMKLMSEAKMILFATQPAWEEPFGIVQIEAMAAGKPLISSDTKATRFLQESGLQAHLVPAEKSSAWADKMAELFHDWDLRKKMGKTNASHAEKFDWTNAAMHYASAYRSAINKAF